MKNKDTTKLYTLLLLGTLAIASAWAARQHIIANRPVAVAPANAQTQALQSQAAQLEAAVRRSPKDLKTRWQLADTYQKLGRLDAAAVQLKSICQIQPTDENAWLGLGNASLAIRQFKEAGSAYDKAVHRWPKSAAAWQGLAAAHYQQREYWDAMDAAKNAVQFAPSDPNNHYVLAASALEYAAEYPERQLHEAEYKLAESELLGLVKVWPKNGDIYARLGRIQAIHDHRKEAIQYFEHALQLSPTAPVYSSLATARMALGDRPGARRAAEEGVASYPDSAGLHDLLGQALQASGEPGGNDRALVEFQKAVQIDPRSEPFQEHLGTAFLRLNRMQDARHAFETAVVLDPNKVFPFQQLSAIYTRLGDIPRATTAAKLARQGLFNADLQTRLHSALLAQPKDVSLHLMAADHYRDIGLVDAARDEYQEILRLDPHNQRAQAALATASTPSSTHPTSQ